MSKFMLDDENAINDINPFVLHDFSLPGSVRQTSNFSDFQEVPPYMGILDKDKSVYCDYGLCTEAGKPCSINKIIQPHRNIDYGFTRGKNENRKEKVVVKVGVSSKSIQWRMILLILIIIVLALLYAKL